MTPPATAPIPAPALWREPGAPLPNVVAHEQVGRLGAKELELRSRGRRLYGASVAVLAGKGNNGGDGLFAASFLAARGMRTTAVLTAGAAHPEALAAFERAGGRVHVLTDVNAGELAAHVAGADVVIDAVLGTGAQGGLRGAAAAARAPQLVVRAGQQISADVEKPIGLTFKESKAKGGGLVVTVSFSLC